MSNKPRAGTLTAARAEVRRAALVATLLVLLACGPATKPSGAVTSPTASPIATLTPSPVSSPSPVAGSCTPCLALVTLRGSGRIVVRDVSDINHPKTVSTLPAGAVDPAFINSAELAYLNAASLYRASLSSASRTLVAKNVGYFAWASNGQTAAYMTADGMHILSASGNRAFGHPLPTPGGFGCPSLECADRWDGRLAFSPDDAYISLLVNIGPITGFHLWSSDGKLLPTPAAQAPTMPVWSGGGFFFRDAKGVEVWRDGGLSPFLPGVAWVRPKASPAGGQIVYEARDHARVAHVYIVDTATGKIRELKSGRTDPVFLTSRYIWYEGERLCVPADNCPIDPTIATGKSYIYDLQTGIEYGSAITSVSDVWPHAA